MDLDYVADVVSIIAGTMTILGISGIVSLSLFTKRESLLSNRVLSVFAMSVKIFLCLVPLPFLYLLLILPWAGAIGIFGGWIPSNPLEMFAIENWTLGNYLGTFVILMFVGPLYLIFVACMLENSLQPLSRFWAKFGGQSGTED